MDWNKVVKDDIRRHVSALTQTQLLRMADQLPEDQSKVVHTFPDDWTIRKLHNFGDVYREGNLMSNCFAPNLHDPNEEFVHEIWADHPDLRGSGIIDLTEIRPENLDLKQPLIRAENPQLPHGGVFGHFYSLRDPQNIPHASIDPYMGTPVDIAAGRHNSEVKPAYAQKIADWARTTAPSGLVFNTSGEDAIQLLQNLPEDLMEQKRLFP